VAWFLIALLIRLLYMLDQAGTSPLFYIPLLDEKEAIDSARAILNGTASAEPYFKAPGYSWFLALVLAISGDAWPWTLRIIQHTAGAALAWLAARLAARLTPAGNRRTLALCSAGFLAATYAPLMRLEENVSLDFWVVFLQSAMLCVLARLPGLTRSQQGQTKQLAIAGVLAAAAWLTRPTITPVLPFIAIWIFVISRRQRPAHRLTAVRAALLFLLPVIIAAAAVTARNYAVSRQPLTLPWQGGFNFYHANKPGATGRYYLQSEIATTADANPTYSLAVDGYRASLSASARARFDDSPNFAAVNKFWMRHTTDAIRANPAQWLSLMARKTVYLFSDKEIFNYEDFDLQRSRSPLLRALPTTFGVVFGLALASVAWLGVLPLRRREISALLWLYTITLGGAIALYYVSGRMRMPIAFPLIVLAGHTVGMFLTSRSPRVLLATTFLLIGVVISYGDWWGVRSESMAHADLARMSNAAWHRGRYEQALDLALQAERLVPDYPVIPRLKGQALYYLGRLPQARVEFQKSVQLLNDDTSRKNIQVIDAELAKQNATANQ
jgi:tetratricopeptide (TPR) repeat protein